LRQGSARQYAKRRGPTTGGGGKNSKTASAGLAQNARGISLTTQRFKAWARLNIYLVGPPPKWKEKLRCEKNADGVTVTRNPPQF